MARTFVLAEMKPDAHGIYAPDDGWRAGDVLDYYGVYYRWEPSGWKVASTTAASIVPRTYRPKDTNGGGNG